MRGFWPAAVAFVLALVATIFCRSVAGRGHGVYFGGVAIAFLLTPYFALIERALLKRALVAAAVTAGVVAVWLSDSERPIEFGAGAGALLATCALASCGLAALLHRLRLPEVAAAAVTAALALAWLSCPIWLSPRLAGRDVAMDCLARAHPLLTLDGMLAPTDRPWSEHEIFYYHLGNLNQDVTYDPPTTPWRAAEWHLVTGALGMALAHARLRRRARRRSD